MFPGHIPPEIGNATSLELFKAVNSGLYGEIPVEIYKLARLKHLTISHCGFTSFPAPPSHNLTLASITNLDLSSNQLEGPMEFVCAMPNLQTLVLSANQLTAFPSCLASLTNLVSFDASSNLISGAIPDEIGVLTKLITLNLKDNQITSISTSMSTCVALRTLDISLNPLSSLNVKDLFLPLYLLPSFTNLRAAGCQLVGSLTYGTLVRTGVAMFPALEELNLRNNSLVSAISSALAWWPVLLRVDLAQNSFIGPIPATFNVFKVLDLSGTVHSLALLLSDLHNMHAFLVRGTCEGRAVVC